MDYFKDLFEKAKVGNTEAFDLLKAGALAGYSDPKNYLSSLYGDAGSPFYDEDQHKFWADKQEERTYYTPNWTWNRDDYNRNSYTVVPSHYIIPQKNGMDSFWRFLGIGIVRALCGFNFS